MAAEAPPTSTPQHAAGPSGPNHGLRIFLIWLPVAIAADLIIWLVWKPHMPPGAMSVTEVAERKACRFLGVAIVRRWSACCAHSGARRMPLVMRGGEVKRAFRSRAR